MSTTELSRRVAALQAEASAMGELLAAEARSMEADELFEVAGALQRVCNATEGAQLVAIAHAAAHETRLTDRGPVELHHGLGFVDQMTSSEVSLATGLGQWAAGRTVSLAASLAERFPRLLEKVVEGDLPCSTVHKVVSVCDGLDLDACAAVQAVLVDRLAGMDPARVTTTTRRVATRVAADQVATASAKNRRDRCVEVSPGPDGTTRWWAQLPAGRSAAAWAAVTALGDTYAEQDPSVTVDQARADALLDLILTQVGVSASVTLGIPVITGPEGDAARGAAVADRVGGDTRMGKTPDRSGAGSTGHGTPGDPPVVATGGLGLGDRFSVSAALSGCQIPRIGWIDAATVEALLSTVPLEVGRALLDARTGTLVETTSSAYRPPRAVTDFVAARDGACRMWGCDRPARRCDVDHVRPWPSGPTNPGNLGELCRRHHRLKQRRRWSLTLDPDGTATWTSPSGVKRVTHPDLTAFPPAVKAAAREPSCPATRTSVHKALAAATDLPPPF